MKAICIKKCFAFNRIFEVGDYYVPNQGDKVLPHFKVTEEAPKVESPKPKQIYKTEAFQEVQKVESEMKLSEIPTEEAPEVAPRKKKK